MNPVKEPAFITHPSDQPLTLRRIDQPDQRLDFRHYRIAGGIQISVHRDYSPGTRVEVRTRVKGQTQSYTAQVLWSRHKRGKAHRLGLVFDNAEEAFKVQVSKKCGKILLQPQLV